MPVSIPKRILLQDLRTHSHEHCEIVQRLFLPLNVEQVNWRPEPREWSILQCIEHLNQTHDYYASRIDPVLRQPRTTAAAADDVYRPSFWGRIYMHFSFNPKYSFPAPGKIVPNVKLDRSVLAVYFINQQALLETFDAVSKVDLTRTAVLLEKAIRFNLGDCLKVLVYHDAQHIAQAQRVLLGKKYAD